MNPYTKLAFILASLLTTTSFNLFGQTTQPKKYSVATSVNQIGEFPLEESVSITQNVTRIKNQSYSIGLFASYSKNSKIGFRLKAITTMRKLRSYTYGDDLEVYDSLNYVALGSHADALKKQTDFLIAPGIFYQFSKEIFSFQAGVEIPFIYHGKTKQVGTYYYVYESNNQLNYTLEKTQTLPKGYSIGMGLFVGLNIKPIKSFQIGLELSSSLLYTSFDGKYYYTEKYLLRPSGVVPPRSSSTKISLHEFQLSSPAVSINLGYSF